MAEAVQCTQMSTEFKPQISVCLFFNLVEVQVQDKENRFCLWKKNEELKTGKQLQPILVIKGQSMPNRFTCFSFSTYKQYLFSYIMFIIQILISKLKLISPPPLNYNTNQRDDLQEGNKQLGNSFDSYQMKPICCYINQKRSLKHDCRINLQVGHLMQSIMKLVSILQWFMLQQLLLGVRHKV